MATLPTYLPDPEPSDNPFTNPAEKLGINARTKNILTRSNLMDEIFSHIANGGSITELCDIWEIRYSSLASCWYPSCFNSNVGKDLFSTASAFLTT